MRFVIYGAGAVGATIGARLAQSGRDVVLIARGAHADAMRDKGLLLQSHEGDERIRVTLQHPRDVRWQKQDVVLLAMKTQDALAALNELAAVAPAKLIIACAQNGVESERLALRRFSNVQGISVMCPCAFLEPGTVQAFGAPVTGILDVGRYPSGSDEVSAQLAEVFRASKFDSIVRPNILRFKYGKLLFNLSNAIEAVCGPAVRSGPIADLVKKEAIASLNAAGVAFDGDEASARAGAVSAKPLSSVARPGGSSWQSLERRTGNIETDYLNGEIVLLGRLAGVPTPANALLQQLSNEMAQARTAPGTLTQDQFLERLAHSDTNR
jgi:2-dehydropantoate 2-reductase